MPLSNDPSPNCDDDTSVNVANALIFQPLANSRLISTVAASSIR